VSSHDRLHSLDAVRGFALLAGVVLHAAMSFLPGFGAAGWPIVDNSPSAALSVAFFAIHMFRMTLFFVIAGFFAHLLFHRRGVRGFAHNRSLRIVVPLVVGWMVVFPAIAATFVWAASKATPVATVAPAPAPALAFPLTHLWFLYALVLLYAAVLVGREVFVRAIDPRGDLRSRIDGWLRAVLSSYFGIVVLALPLTAALYLTPGWLAWFGIPTPDQSLIPNPTAAVAYGGAFALGWVMHRQPGLLQAWQRQWAVHLAIAITTTVASVSMVGAAPVFSAAPPGWNTLAYAGIYALGTWSWTMGLIGVALRFFAEASPVRRYLADASYWIYLVHLPLVFALQVAVQDRPWHWSVKFPLIVVVALVVLLGSYHALVRYSFIGDVLNGRRHRRVGGAAFEVRLKPDATSGSDVRLTPEATSETGVPLTKLSDVRKRYGKVQALDGLSLEVRPGELLAVLGPNGAGKSTAISLLLGLQEPDEGSATLMGLSPGLVEARYRVGVMMQEAALSPELRVREHIDLVTTYYPSPMSAGEAMALTHTLALADRPYGKLSGGQKRQVQFAIALCGRPALLFLDEPTVGLDVQAREMLWATLRQLVAQGVAIVLTTHYIEEAEALASRVAVVANGRLIAAGTVNEMRALVARKRIRCATTTAVDDIRGWAGVVSAAVDGDHVLIVATDADAVVRRLLAADAQARDLEVQRAGLAEAFTELTQEAA